jgi:hypothetical protein
MPMKLSGPLSTIISPIRSERERIRDGYREQTGHILRKEKEKEAVEIQNETGWGGRAAHDEEARRGR